MNPLTHVDQDALGGPVEVNRHLQQARLHGDLAWVFDLHREMLLTDHGVPAARVSPMFARLAREQSEAREEREEVKAYRAAYAELLAEQPELHAAIEGFTRQRKPLTQEGVPAVIAGFELLADKVDAAMGE